MTTHKVNWYRGRVKLALENADERILDQLAMQTLGQARINIRENKQIDTGFMTNSGYVVSAKRNGFLLARAAAAGRANREMSATPPVKTRVESAVTFGAHYAIYQEIRRSFLFIALQSISKQAGGIIREESF